MTQNIEVKDFDLKLHWVGYALRGKTHVLKGSFTRIVSIKLIVILGSNEVWYMPIWQCVMRIRSSEVNFIREKK